MELEKRGLPTVNFTATFFMPLAKATAHGRGLAELAIVEVPYPLEGKPLSEVRELADNTLDAALKALLSEA